MTLEKLIIDLKAAGANENTILLAMNCYELGQKEGEKSAALTHKLFCDLAIAAAVRTERKACVKIADDAMGRLADDAWCAAREIKKEIEARGES